MLGAKVAFKFKQFSVSDDRSTMKVGTDAVLLGAWADVANAKSILDIGTGCGVIALMLAQRSNAIVDAVEIDVESAKQAKENFDASPWKINIHNTAVQDLAGQYDLIVSNPPFFNNSLLPPASSRQKARHTTTLTHEDLMKSVSRLLTPGGKFAVIVPDNALISNPYGLTCSRATAVYPRQKLERWLLEFSSNEKASFREEERLVLFDGDERSQEYSRLTREFYL